MQLKGGKTPFYAHIPVGWPVKIPINGDAELGYELQEPVMSASPQTFSLHDEAAEKKRILEALKQTGNNKSKAAILLGIDRKTLYNKLKLYDIQ